jgi:hypothetical protein
MENRTAIIVFQVLALELGVGIGKIVYWYEPLANKRRYSTKVKDISVKKYKEILWDMLAIAGYKVDDIKQQLIIDESKVIPTIP